LDLRLILQVVTPFAGVITDGASAFIDSIKVFLNSEGDIYEPLLGGKEEDM
jgi:hypothetical protein